nr:MAG TPA_asm: hypothetical protein [Caudoviricetes sp.]
MKRQHPDTFQVLAVNVKTQSQNHGVRHLKDAWLRSVKDGSGVLVLSQSPAFSSFKKT